MPASSNSRTFAIALVSLLLGLALGMLLKGEPAPAATTSSRVELDRLDSPAVAKTEAETMALSEAPGARDLAKASLAESGISEARLAAATAAVEMPEVEIETGTGSITGTVLDEDGQPLGDVTIVARKSRAEPGYYVRSTETVGSGPPAEASLNEILEFSARSWAERRAAKRRTTTAPNGTFVLDGLPDASFGVQAYKEGWSIHADGHDGVKPGMIADFKATRVHVLELDVRLPDGSAPSDVIVTCKSGNSSSNYRLDPETHTLRLTAERLTIQVFADMLEAVPMERALSSRFFSEEVLVDTAALPAGPLRVELTERLGVRGLAHQPWKKNEMFEVSVVPLDGPGDTRFDIGRAGARTTIARNERYLVLDLDPGWYAVGIEPRSSRTGAELHFAEVFELQGPGIAEVDLDIPEPSPADHVRLVCTDPAGRPLDDLHVTHNTTSPGGSIRGDAEPLHAPDGSLWIPTGNLASFDYDHWPESTSITLTIRSSSLGSRTIDLASGQYEVEVVFTQPVSLTATIANYDRKAQLSVRVMRSADSGNRETLTQSLDPRGFGSGPAISREGRVVFTTIPPGDWEVELVLNRQFTSGTVIDSVPVTITSADAAITLTMQPLFELSVLAPTLPTNAYIELEVPDQRFGGASGHLDADHHVLFENLVAGTYTLHASGSEDSLEVTVPSAEIVFEPRIPRLISIAIVDETGSLFQAGFRTADVVTAIDGRSLIDFESLELAFEELIDGSHDLTLRRDGKLVHLTLDGLDFSRKGRMALGGTLLPAYEE
jgi:hypothetical protein